MTKQVYGYIRVSSRDQNVQRQMLSFLDLGIEIQNIFIDKQSGKDFERKHYKRLLRKLRKGDLFIVKSIDRLGRNYEEILIQWRYITKNKKVDIRVIDMPLLDTTISKDLLGTFISDLVLQLLSFVAENEREMIRARQAEGILAAKKRGVRFGRPEKEIPSNFSAICESWKNSLITLPEALDLLDMSRSTFYRKVKKYANCAQ
ncbi:recombinase family protein [Anaerosinus sp.]